MNVCFIGHRNIPKTEGLISSLKETVATLINNGATTFFFGSGSDFNTLSWEVVTEFKTTYSHIKRVYVRSSYKRIDDFYKEYLLQFYEETYLPQKIENAGRYSYVERNNEMIDNSTYCVFYYDENYVPVSKCNSGTKNAYEYAKRKNKKIINLYNLII